MYKSSAREDEVKRKVRLPTSLAEDACGWEGNGNDGEGPASANRPEEEHARNFALFAYMQNA